MSKRDDGGAAFPGLEFNPHSDQGRALDGQNSGMTLRDYFAAAALEGISGHISGPKEKAGETSAQAHARWSYAVADAMLLERSK